MISLLLDLLGALSWLAFTIVVILILSAVRVTTWLLAGAFAALRRSSSPASPRRRVVFRGDRPD